MNFRLMIFVVCMILFGCSTTSYGQKAPVQSAQDLPSAVRVGQHKKDVFQVLGPPDKTHLTAEREYWTYRVVKGSYFLFLGTVKYRDLIIEYETDRVVDVYHLDRGNAMGMFAPPGYSN